MSWFEASLIESSGHIERFLSQNMKIRQNNQPKCCKCSTFQVGGIRKCHAVLGRDSRT